MPERLRTTEYTLTPSEIEKTPEVILDFHNPLKSDNLLPTQEARELAAEADKRMLNLETPKTLTEIKRDHAHLIGSNLEALRHQKLQAALSENATKEDFGLAG